MFISRGGFLRRQGDMTSIISQSNVYSANTDTTVVYQYNNGVHKLIIGGNEATATDTTYDVDYFIGVGVGAKSKIKELKIKPL